MGRKTGLKVLDDGMIPFGGSHGQLRFHLVFLIYFLKALLPVKQRDSPGLASEEGQQRICLQIDWSVL